MIIGIGMIVSISFVRYIYKKVRMRQVESMNMIEGEEATYITV